MNFANLRIHGFRAMDNLHAPQWVDFNASDRSDVDDFFNVEHKELESGYRWNASSDSPADSPVSSNGDDTHRTPRSNGYASPSVASVSGGRKRFNRTSESLAKAMSALHIKSAKKALLRQSMTPGPKIPTANSTLTNDIPEDDDDVRTQEEEYKTNNVHDTEHANISVQEEPETLSTPGVTAEEPNTGDKPTLLVSEKEEDDASREPDVTIQTAGAETAAVNTEENISQDRSAPEEKSSDEKKASDELPKSEENPREDRAKSEENPREDRAKSEENPREDLSKREKNPSHARSTSKDRPKIESRLDPSKPSCPGKKNPRAKPENARVLVNNVRRHSIAKYRRRASGQYVGLAEAVARFQNGTPKRFRSARHPDNQPGPLPKAKQTRMKLTCPMSPALLCKTRTRAVPASSAADPQPRVKDAKPFAQSLRSTRGISSNNARATKKSEKPAAAAAAAAVKTQPMLPPPTVPEAGKKMDKPLAVPSLSGNPNATLSSMLSSSMMSTSTMSESVRKQTPGRKTISTLVSCEEGTAIQQVEIVHFGIPVGKSYKKITRPIPFSFERRGKEAPSKREKSQQVQEKPMKALVKPAPSANPAKKTTTTTTTTTTTSVLKPKENNASKVPLCALTFQQRNELTLRKKREMMDQIVEKEKQARVFHAKPAPHFKPVFVRGNSDLRAAGDGGRPKKRGISPAPGQRGLNQESIALSNQENKAPNNGP